MLIRKIKAELEEREQKRRDERARKNPGKKQKRVLSKTRASPISRPAVNYRKLIDLPDDEFDEVLEMKTHENERKHDQAEKFSVKKINGTSMYLSYILTKRLSGLLFLFPY